MQSKRIQPIILFLFFLSGAAGLIYEVVWQGMLNLVFGNTTFATTTVVASFMGGMALGAYLFGRLADRSGRPLRLYAFLEIGIGAFALLFPLILSMVGHLQLAVFRAFPTVFYNSNVIKFILCFVVLLIPSLLMGGTLPVVSRFFVTDLEHVSGGVGRLYGFNTLGGVTGAFCAVFFLITSLGVRQITFTAAVINLLVAVAALGLNRLAVTRGVQAIDRKTREAGKPEQQTYPGSVRSIVLIIYGLSGFCALAYEVLWTRILAFFLGNSTHAFAVMLTTYLLGLALGSLIFAKVLDRVRHPLTLLAFIEVFIGLFALFSLWEFSILGDILGGSFAALGGRWGALIVSRYFGAFFIMSVPTLLIGIAFPLVNRIFAGSFQGLARGIGSVSAVNTAGCILGSVTAGFLLIPAIGITKSVIVIALINVLLGTAAAASAMLTGHKVKWAAVATAAAVIGVLAALIGTPSIRFHSLLAGHRLIYYSEGASSTVAVSENERGYRFLVVNGVYEVSTDYNSLRTFHMLGHLPLLLHENPQNVLVISFGAGVTSGAVARHDVRKIDAVEISPEVAKANSYFTKENQAVLSDSRVNLIIDDGRNYLLRTLESYDVITADATHPTGSDSWVLYTREFYELCRSRLNPGGFMAQWVPVHALAPVDYKMIVKTFQAVFPNATLWFTNDYTILLGSTEKLSIDFDVFSKRLQEPQVKADLDEYDLADPYAFLGAFVMGGESLAEYSGDVRLNTDNYPYVQSSEKRSQMGTNPANLLELGESIESALPLVRNVTIDPEALRGEVERYTEVVRHIIRARGYYYMRDIERQIEEYEKALAIKPGDKNTTRLLEIARPLFE